MILWPGLNQQRQSFLGLCPRFLLPGAQDGQAGLPETRDQAVCGCFWRHACIILFSFYRYMTDGGLGLYTRRLNRLPDGMAVVRETLQRNTSLGLGDADR